MRTSLFHIGPIALAALCCGIVAGALAQAPTPKGAAPAATAVATFAGGCFWCMEPPFDKVPGVISTTSGYTGGTKPRPTYEEVSSGTTGHAEAVQVVYDATKVTYEKLLDVFWHNIDPTVTDRQFCDHGSQYRTAIFVHNAEQRRLAGPRLSAQDQHPAVAPAHIRQQAIQHLALAVTAS